MAEKINPEAEGNVSMDAAALRYFAERRAAAIEAEKKPALSEQVPEMEVRQETAGREASWEQEKKESGQAHGNEPAFPAFKTMRGGSPDNGSGRMPRSGGSDYYMNLPVGQFAGLVEESRTTPQEAAGPWQPARTDVFRPAEGASEKARMYQDEGPWDRNGNEAAPVALNSSENTFHPGAQAGQDAYGAEGTASAIPDMSDSAKDYYMNLPAGRFADLVEESRTTPQEAAGPWQPARTDVFRPAEGASEEIKMYQDEAPRDRNVNGAVPVGLQGGQGHAYGAEGTASAIPDMSDSAKDYYMNLPVGRFADLVNESKMGAQSAGSRFEVHDNDYYMSLDTSAFRQTEQEHDHDYYMSLDTPEIRKYREMYRQADFAGSGSFPDTKHNHPDSRTWQASNSGTWRMPDTTIGEIAGYNRYLNDQQKIKKVKGYAAHVISAPASLIKQAVSERNEEGYEVEEAAENLKFMRFAGGEYVDVTEMSDIVERNMLMVNRQTRAGNIFKSDLYKDRDIFKPAAFAGARIVDRNKVTDKDVYCFRVAKNLGPDKLDLLNIDSIKFTKFKSRDVRKEIESMVLSSEINSFEEFVRTLNREEPGFFTEAEKLVLDREDALLIARNSLDFETNAAMIKKVLASPKLSGAFADVDFDAMGSKELKDLVRRRKRGIPGRGKNLLDIEKNPLFAAGIKALYQNQISLEAANRVQMRRAARAAQARSWAKGRVFRLMNNDADFAAMQSGVSAEMSLFRTGAAAAANGVKLGSMAGYGTASVLNAGLAGGFDLVGADRAAETVRSAGRMANRGIDATRKTAKKIVRLPGDTARRATQAVGAAAGHTAGAVTIRIQTSLTNTAAYKAFVSNPAVKFISGGAFHVRLFLRQRIDILANIFKAPGRFLRKVFGIGGKGLRIAFGVIGAILLLQCAFILLFSGNAAPSSVVTVILSNRDQFADYQKKYDDMDAAFTNRVASIINGYARTKDYSGAQIHYGINKPKQVLKGYSNTANPYERDYELAEEFVNGAHLGYLYNGSAASGLSSNIKDCLAAMTVIMGQNQAAHHKEALELLGALYQSTHSYVIAESPLYYCNHGDTLLHYFCNEKTENYPSSPLLANSSVKTFESPFDPEANGFVCTLHKKLDPEHPKTYCGCQIVDSPEEYEGVESDTYTVVEDMYDDGRTGYKDYTYKAGIPDANPEINTLSENGKKRCFHNAGKGNLIHWDMLLHADEEDDRRGRSRYERYHYGSNDDGESYVYYDEYHGGEDNDDYCNEVPQFGSTSAFSSLIEDLKDGSLDGNYKKAKFDVSEVPDWLLGEDRCDNWGYYAWYNHGTYVYESARRDYEKEVDGIGGIVFYCKGHDHYGCETGHDVPVCYGHVGLNMAISINGVEKIFELGGVPITGDSSEVDEDLLAGAKKKDSAEIAETDAAEESNEGKDETVYDRESEGEDEEE